MFIIPTWYLIQGENTALLEEVVVSNEPLFGKTWRQRSNVHFVQENLIQSLDIACITRGFISQRCNKQRCGWLERCGQALWC